MTVAALKGILDSTVEGDQWFEARRTILEPKNPETTGKVVHEEYSKIYVHWDRLFDITRQLSWTEYNYYFHRLRRAIDTFTGDQQKALQEGQLILYVILDGPSQARQITTDYAEKLGAMSCIGHSPFVTTAQL